MDLKERRIRADLTQEELAKKTGLSQSAISKFERGDEVPNRVTTLRCLADALGCTVSDLLAELPIIPPPPHATKGRKGKAGRRGPHRSSVQQ